MTELDHIIYTLIQKEGPISVARYMQLALQHPEHGYYMKGDPLGIAGDFTTSPEISQMFGELIGLWFADLWKRAGKPAKFSLLEMGPGRGTLMQDALRGTERVPGFHDAMDLLLMESNETLRQQQRERLGKYNPRYVEHIDEVGTQPLFVIANEFFDALPIHQYVRQDDGWHERLVGIVDDDLDFVLAPLPTQLPLPIALLFFEIAPQAIGLAQQVAERVYQFGGGGLIIDYGYAVPSGADTLQAVSGHASAPVLAQAGRVDITAHVDFAALRTAALQRRCHVPPVITQGVFLQALGIEIRAGQLKLKATAQQALEIDDAVRRLIDPSEMGSLFKVMAITPPDQTEVSGF